MKDNTINCYTELLKGRENELRGIQAFKGKGVGNTEASRVEKKGMYERERDRNMPNKGRTYYIKGRKKERKTALGERL